MRLALLVIANVLIPLAVLIFATGFFPYKPFIPGLASHHDFAEYGISGDAPDARFNKIILMVVDALRSDFVFSNHSGFAFTQSLIRSGEAMPFTAHASSPTITMPKVKAITTGSIPSFLDVILNFAESDTSSSLAEQDTWLAQIHAGPQGNGSGRLIMYGDDTWLKLFPQTFVRADGTSSFFVSDFTEVDNNVTRHVPRELRNDDWDAMIMHYLGLDHIGHKAGPWSPNMLPKQREMDDIVKSIYQAMQSQPHLKDALLILCGDHGMTDGGNHGGSNPGETSPAVVFFSPKLQSISSGQESPIASASPGGFEYYDRIDQSDLAPTISSLLGRPIPKNSLGIVMPQLLPLWSNDNDRLDLLHRNSLQILSIVKATFSSSKFAPVHDNINCDSQSTDDADDLACAWRLASRQDIDSSSSSDLISSRIKAWYGFLKRAQEVLSSTASNYDFGRLVGGVVLATISSIMLCIVYASTAVTSATQIIILAGISGLYGFMMFASSYVEEEQQFWYWIATGWIGLLTFQSHRTITSRMFRSTARDAFLLLLLLRISRRWNQTGQKHVGAPDIVRGYLARRPHSLWLLVALTYTAALTQAAYSMALYLRLGASWAILGSLFMALVSMALKLSFIASDAPELLSFLSLDQLEILRRLSVVLVARSFFVAFLAFSVLTVIRSRSASTSNTRVTRRSILQSAFSLVTLLLLTQSRTQNLPLFFFFMLQHKSLQRLAISPFQISLNTIIMAHTSFFALGNSNAISSVDLSNGYNGVGGFNVLAVGLLVFVSNWAGPIFWAMSGIVLLSRRRMQRHDKQRKSRSVAQDDSYMLHLTITSLFIAISTLAMMVACTVLRTHLFIWTVFSPKYLYTMAWSLGYHYLVNIGLCGGLWRLTSHLH